MSERIEERLRRAAQTYRKLGNHTAEGMFLEAADTIWQLRDDLQQTKCDECPYNGLDDEHDDCNCTVREKVNSLARELGVEVDE